MLSSVEGDERGQKCLQIYIALWNSAVIENFEMKLFKTELLLGY